MQAAQQQYGTQDYGTQGSGRYAFYREQHPSRQWTAEELEGFRVQKALKNEALGLLGANLGAHQAAINHQKNGLKNNPNAIYIPFTLQGTPLTALLGPFCPEFSAKARKIPAVWIKEIGAYVINQDPKTQQRARQLMDYCNKLLTARRDLGQRTNEIQNMLRSEQCQRGNFSFCLDKRSGFILMTILPLPKPDRDDNLVDYLKHDLKARWNKGARCWCISAIYSDKVNELNSKLERGDFVPGTYQSSASAWGQRKGSQGGYGYGAQTNSYGTAPGNYGGYGAQAAQPAQAASYGQNPPAQEQMQSYSEPDVYGDTIPF